MKKTYTKTTVTTEPKLVIKYDQDSESPRQDSNLGYFITVDRNYNSPDNNGELETIVKETGNEAESQAEHIDDIEKRINEETLETVLAIYPIVKYEHGGVSYSLGTKHGFDYSNNGFYIITDKTQKEVGTDKKDFESVIENELEVYNKYTNGEVYGFILYDDDGEVEESCWGFYDLEAIQENLPKEWQDEDMQEYLITD